MIKEGSLEFQSKFSIARTGVIIPGTLTDSIELLSDSKHTPSISDYVNLVVRYAVMYLGGASTDKVTNEVSQRVLAKLMIPSFRTNEEQTLIQGSEYQLRMLFDIGATVEVIRDIIERKIDTNVREYSGIDLGTGTGIALLAQYIQARRNGYEHSRIKNIGIEINEAVIPRVQGILSAFNFGTIVYGDTTNSDTYVSFRDDKISFVTNENLPYPGMPYSGFIKRDRKNGDLYNVEPFFYNIDALLSSGVDISDTDFFPALVENQLLKSNRRLFSKGIYAIPFTSEGGKKVVVSQKSLGLVREINPQFLQEFLSPKAILIGESTTPLSEIGNQYYMLNHEDGRPNDYQYTEEQVLSEHGLARGRWNPSAISGVERKSILIS